MSTSEKFCLRWNDFLETGDLGKDTEFTVMWGRPSDWRHIESSCQNPALSFRSFSKGTTMHTHWAAWEDRSQRGFVGNCRFLVIWRGKYLSKNVDAFNIANEFQLKGLHGTEDKGWKEGKRGEISNGNIIILLSKEMEQRWRMFQQLNQRQIQKNFQTSFKMKIW